MTRLWYDGNITVIKERPLNISIVLSLLGGVALFLFGMLLMGDNLKKVAGSKLELVLYRLSGTSLRGILLGTGVTAVIQSSSATCVMVVGFVNSGMMKVRQAIAVTMGAIIGTSVTGWIICLSDLSGSGWLSLLSTDTLTSVVAVVGIVLSMFSKKASRKNVGGILMGFAVLMFGMKTMSSSVASLRSNPVFLQLLTGFSAPLMGVLVGALFTAVIQSASAAVGILQALAITGAVTVEVAVPIIMGISIGAALPVILSALGASAEGRRSALSYLVINTVGSAVFALLFYGANTLMDFSFMDFTLNSVGIALLNSVFRAMIVLLEAPFLGALERLVTAMVPSRESAEEVADIDRLEERFLSNPALAVEQSRLTVCSMAEKTMENLLCALGLIRDYSPEGFERVEKAEDVIDRYEDKLGSYLVKITAGELDEQQYKAVGEYLRAITDLERIGDHAVNLAESAGEIWEKKITFSPDGERELGVLIAAVEEIVRLTVAAFTEGDVSHAYRIEPLEELIDGLCDEMKQHHIQRVQSGGCTLSNGFVFNDLLTDLERVADHCSNIGVAMIEQTVELNGAHDYLQELRVSRTAAFEQYMAEYAGRFKV